jgi:hypothetical protein
MRSGVTSSVVGSVGDPGRREDFGDVLAGGELAGHLRQPDCERRGYLPVALVEHRIAP